MTATTNRRTGRPYLAVVLGTALSALAPAAAPAAETVADLNRYCTACWRNARLPADQWQDCTQEVFRRLLERVPVRSWVEVLDQDSEERRELVRAIDAVKKRVQRARKATGSLDGVADRSDAVRRQRADDREAVQAAAAEVLSARQRRVLQLSFEGWSVAEIAEELALPAERVSDEKYKAIRKLRAHLGIGAAGSLPA
jgi:RNA polymerase sigma factor (sigma-70 family)